MKKAHSKLLLSIWIYIGWFGCMYLGKMGLPAASLVVPVISWLLMIYTFGFNQKLLARLIVLFFIGILFDSFGSHLNLIQVNPSAEIGKLPLWMISIWLLFISSLPLLQNLFQKKYILAALLGAIFGPLSYRAGAQFGTLFITGALALTVYSVFWAIYITFAIFWLNKNKLIEKS